MIVRMEIREVLGMLGTMAALSVVGSAVLLVDAEIVEVRDTPTVEQRVSLDVPNVSVDVRVAPPAVKSSRGLEEVRLQRPDVAAPPLRCPPLGDGRVRGQLKSCREILV